MSGGVIAAFVAGTVSAVSVGVLTSLVTTEAEGRIDGLPMLLLRVARRRLPESSRDDLYDEWAAELHAALHGTQGRPLSRLVLGIRFAAGLVRTARQIADELGTARRPAPDQRDDDVAADTGPVAVDLPGFAMPAQARGGPTVLRIILGAQLRRLRERNQITRGEAAVAMRASGSKISRMELGRVSFRSRDVADLLTLYGITDPQEREALLELAARSNDRGWWHQYADILPHWFEVYIGLEEAASSIRSFELQCVPGLLQTEDYARAVTVRGHPFASGDEIERRVGLLMRRQALLTAPASPRYWVVVDEAALRRPMGGRSVMREQLEHLIDVSESPTVTLQVAPFHLGSHAVAGGSPFSILRFADPDLPDVVYLEQLTSALYLDKRADVDHYTEAMERLAVLAEPADTTISILRSILREL
jgi:transcriptional regulator with XRE-family HTH domain